MESLRSVPVVFMAVIALAGCGSPQNDAPKSSEQSASPVRSDQRIGGAATNDPGEPIHAKQLRSELRVPNSVQLLDGTSVDLRPRGGQKVTLLYIWTTYTASILEDVASLESLASRHRDNSLRVFSVNCTDSRDEVQRFVSENKLRIPVALDADRNVTNRLRITSVPSLYLVDGRGTASLCRIGPLADVDIEGAIAKFATK
jgi:hypothetical protein